MIQLTSAGKRFGEKLLFEDADWQINPGRPRRAWSAPTAPARRTLLKILAGQESLDYGELSVNQRRQRRLPAAVRPGLSGRTVFAECLSVFEELTRRGGRDGIADPPHGAPRPRRPGICRGRRPLPPPRARVPHARRLCARSPGGHRSERAGIPQGRLAPPHRGVLRRLADAHRAGQTAARETQPAAARRAHQPPRSGGAELAGAIPLVLSLRVRAGLARPLLPRRHRHEGRGDLEQAAATSTRATTRAISS